MSILTPANCTFLFEVGTNAAFLWDKLEYFKKDIPDALFLIVSSENGTSVTATGHSGISTGQWIKIDRWADLIPVIKTPYLAFLPAATPYSTPIFRNVPLDGETLLPWAPLLSLSPDNGTRVSVPDMGWMGSVEILKGHLGSTRSLGLRYIAESIERNNVALKFLSSRQEEIKGVQFVGQKSVSKITRSSPVLAIIPHRNCHQFLEQALHSLVHQTRQLEGIVVIDDKSDVLPSEIVKKFPEVTLLRSPDNVGPYALVQSVIDTTNYGAYLFQDADDWCSVDRLELLLDRAEETGAELLGTQELMFFDNAVNANHYPLDVNRALLKGPSYALVHPSSLVSRDLVQRLGGYATGLKFSGDFEFQNRVIHRALAVNVDAYAYFRRMRQGSLTLSPETGLISPARTELDNQIRNKAWENLKRVSEGKSVDVEPLKSFPLVHLEWILGPQLRNSLSLPRNI